MSTADRALSVLQLFTLDEPEWTVEEAAERLKISNSTAYRYFSSLNTIGFVESLTTGVYTLGPAIIEYDRQIRMLDPLLSVARPVMQRLVEMSENKAAALLCRRYRLQVMCVHLEHEENLDAAVSYERGRPMGLLRGAASRVILAQMPARTLKSIYEDQAKAIAKAGLGGDWSEFRSALRVIRLGEVLIAHAQLDPGKVGVAAPVMFPADNVIGSVSMVMSEGDATNQMLARMSTLVLAGAREIEAGLIDGAARHEAKVSKKKPNSRRAAG